MISPAKPLFAKPAFGICALLIACLCLLMAVLLSNGPIEISIEAKAQAKAQTDDPQLAKSLADQGPVVYIFVAAWCAPCHGEVREFANWRRLAAPMKIIYIPADNSKRTLLLLEKVPPAHKLILDHEQARSLLSRWNGNAAGLPFNIAFNRKGQLCGRARRALDAELLGEWQQNCR